MLWDRQNLFVMAGFVSTCFTVILPLSDIFHYNGVFVRARFIKMGFHCIRLISNSNSL